MKIKILQLRPDSELHVYHFSSMRMLKSLGLTVDLNNYTEVYSSVEPDKDYDNVETTLESLYIKFQGVKPEGYTGHSLSVSDIIVLNDVNYFVDIIGFVKL